MAKQSDLDLAYMKMASAMADLSQAKRKKVGAIVVSSKGYGVIAEGFNGTPPGFDNKCERTAWCINGNPDNAFGEEILSTCHQENGVWKTGRGNTVEPMLVTLDEVLHAEENAIAKLAEFGHSSFGATLYCTCAPCLRCARQIIACKITRVVYSEIYRNDLGLRLLEKARIVVANVPLVLQNDDTLTQQDEGRYDLHEDQYRA